jgi:hypothetical protein
MPCCLPVLCQRTECPIKCCIVTDVHSWLQKPQVAALLLSPTMLVGFQPDQHNAAGRQLQPRSDESAALAHSMSHYDHHLI